MVNWDPEAKTTLSDEEVIYEEQQGKLYFLKYRIEGSADFLTVATTRPKQYLEILQFASIQMMNDSAI
jgi:valyl-tRNA synthetase